MAVKRSGRSKGQRAEVSGRLAASITEASYFLLGTSHSLSIPLDRDEARELAPLLAHYAEHGTLWKDPAPLKRVRCKVAFNGAIYDAEGYDDESVGQPLFLLWRDSEGKVVRTWERKDQVTDLEYITG